MRITKIEIEGREGRYATIARRRPGRWIEVTILTPYQPDGQIHRIAANADGDEFRRQARNLQTVLDGVRGTNGDIDDYLNELLRFAD